MPHCLNHWIANIEKPIFSFIIEECEHFLYFVILRKKGY